MLGTTAKVLLLARTYSVRQHPNEGFRLQAQRQRFASENFLVTTSQHPSALVPFHYRVVFYA